MASADMPILAPARISKQEFYAILIYRNSPAAIYFNDIFDNLTQYGVDPEVALGMFAAESNYGKVGYATVTLNWGNILYYLWIEQNCSDVEPYSPGNGLTYAKFTDWSDSVVCAYTPLLVKYDFDGYDTLYKATARWLGATPGSLRHMTYLNNVLQHIDGNQAYLGVEMAAVIKIVEETWKGPLNHPFYDNPFGTQIGRFSKAFSVYSYGHFLDTQTRTVNPNWGAVRVTTGAIDGISADKIVWIERTSAITVSPYVEPPKDCSLEIEEAVAPLHDEIAVLEQDLESADQEIESLEGTVASLNEENQSLAEENMQLENDKTTLQEANNELIDENEELHNNVNMLNNDIQTIVVAHEVIHKHS